MCPSSPIEMPCLRMRSQPKLEKPTWLPSTNQTQALTDGTIRKIKVVVAVVSVLHQVRIFYKYIFRYKASVEVYNPNMVQNMPQPMQPTQPPAHVQQQPTAPFQYPSIQPTASMRKASDSLPSTPGGSFFFEE